MLECSRMLDTEARAKVALVARVQDLGAGVAGVCVRLLRRAWVARAGEGVRGDRVNEKAARGPAGWCAASGMVRAGRPIWGAGEAPRVRVKEVMLRRERERGVRERQRASRPGGVRPRTRRPENQPAWRAAARRRHGVREGWPSASVML